MKEPIIVPKEVPEELKPAVQQYLLHDPDGPKLAARAKQLRKYLSDPDTYKTVEGLNDILNEIDAAECMVWRTLTEEQQEQIALLIYDDYQRYREAKPGDWSLIQSHITEVIAGGNEEFAEYVLKWVAWSIQNPAAQAEVALVLIGEKGAGKGTLVRCLQRIFGAHAFQVTTQAHVIDKFNGHLEDCILFIADEAYWGGDKRCVGRLQGMITEPTLSIERLGIDTIEVPNYLHMLMLAEPGWVIPAGRHERRYAALAVSGDKRGDRGYFKALHRQILEGGAEAMFYDLQRLALGDWHPREIPEALLKGKALQEQQTHTLPPWEQWFLMLLHSGSLPGATKRHPNVARTTWLVDDAKALIPRLKFDASVYTVRSFLLDAKRIGLACKKFQGRDFNGWEFYPLTEHRKAWESLYGEQLWETDVEEWIVPKADDGGLFDYKANKPKCLVVSEDIGKKPFDPRDK